MVECPHHHHQQRVPEEEPQNFEDAILAQTIDNQSPIQPSKKCQCLDELPQVQAQLKSERQLREFYQK